MIKVFLVNLQFDRDSFHDCSSIFSFDVKLLLKKCVFQEFLNFLASRLLIEKIM